jgi:hypothetical protein
MCSEVAPFRTAAMVRPTNAIPLRPFSRVPKAMLSPIERHRKVASAEVMTRSALLTQQHSTVRQSVRSNWNFAADLDKFVI